MDLASFSPKTVVVIRLIYYDSLQQDNADPQNPPFGITKVRITTLRKKMGKENTEDPIWESEKWCIFSPREDAQWHFHRGCSQPLVEWVNSSGDILFVIGFCVIAFLKLTFLGEYNISQPEILAASQLDPQIL